jgi:hypothetical protein
MLPAPTLNLIQNAHVPCMHVLSTDPCRLCRLSPISVIVTAEAGQAPRDGRFVCLVSCATILCLSEKEAAAAFVVCCWCKNGSQSQQSAIKQNSAQRIKSLLFLASYSSITRASCSGSVQLLNCSGNHAHQVLEPWGAIHQLLNIILKLRILVLLHVSTLQYVVKVGNNS